MVLVICQRTGRRYGCVVQKSVTENTTLATMEEFTSGIFINKSKEKEVSEKYVKELATKTPNCEQLVVNLPVVTSRRSLS